MSESAAPDVVAITDSFEQELIAPPLTGGQSCLICCDVVSDEDPRCGKCRTAAVALDGVVTPVVPITIYVKPSEMRERLSDYKNSASESAGRRGLEVAAMLDRFFLEHGSELSSRYGAIDVAAVVPSKRVEGLRAHPLSEALDSLPATHVPPREPLLRRGVGKIERRVADPAGFIADEAARLRTVAVLDDVYTTGATAQSAAYALRAAGATVPVIVVVGRRLNPGTVPGVSELVDRQRARGFRWNRSPWE